MKTIQLTEFALWANSNMRNWKTLEGAWIRHKSLGWCRLNQQRGRYFYFQDPSGSVRAFTLQSLLDYFVEVGDVNDVAHIIGHGGQKYISKDLRTGCVYSRAQLIKRFFMSSLEIRKGLARPAGANSLALFIPKGRGATNNHASLGTSASYEFKFDPTNRIIKQVINHEDNGDELIVFDQEVDAAGTAWEFLFRGRVRCIGRVHDRQDTLLIRALEERKVVPDPLLRRPALSIDELRAKLALALLS